MWFYESVLYQIYPLGFCGAPQDNNGEVGHNILKVKDWVPHLTNLGIDCVLFNPIFESDHHGYDTRDYSLIDKRLGTNDEFADVCKALKQANIRIVLDGVFNHVGRGFWAFQDVLKNRENSPYKDWFHIDFGGNSNYNDGLWYKGWEGHFELVTLNLNNPAVVDHLLDCVLNWIKDFDIDGIRLDVAYLLEGDFMRRLRGTTTAQKADFALIGEIIHGDYNRIVNDEMLHSCTNYECYKGIFSSLNDVNMFEISHSLHRQFSDEQWSLYKGKHLMNFVDNHDVSRIASILKDKNNILNAYGLLLGMPGVPCIYYGSEWGEEGDKNKGSDWHLRPCFEAPKPNDLTLELSKIVNAHKKSKALCYGGYKNITITNPQLLFLRQCPEESVYVAINAVSSEATLHSGDLQGEFVDLITGTSYTLSGSVNLTPYRTLFLKKM